jgi:hypothetical protein
VDSIVVFGVDNAEAAAAFGVRGGDLTEVDSVALFGVSNFWGERGGMGVFGVEGSVAVLGVVGDVVEVEGPATTNGATVFLGVGIFPTLSSFNFIFSLETVSVDSMDCEPFAVTSGAFASSVDTSSVTPVTPAAAVAGSSGAFVSLISSALPNPTISSAFSFFKGSTTSTAVCVAVVGAGTTVVAASPFCDPLNSIVRPTGMKFDLTLVFCPVPLFP